MSRSIGIALGAAVLMGGLAVRLSQPHDVSGAAVPSVREVTRFRTGYPLIRVLLGGRPVSVWTIRVDGPYRVTTLDDWTVLAQGNQLDRVDVSADGDGLRIGQKRFLVRRLKIQVRESGSLWVGARRYRGDLHLIRWTHDQIAAVNALPLEEYLASVVAAEMPSDAPLAAQRAQAIAVRTTALVKMKTTRPDQDYDVTDSPRIQTYLGIEDPPAAEGRKHVETAVSRQVVDETRDVILIYQGQPYEAHDTLVCGGHSAYGPSVFEHTAPPLIGVACNFCQSAPNYRWQFPLDVGDVEQKLNDYLRRLGKRIGKLQSIKIQEDETYQGEVPKLHVAGSQDSHTMSAINFQLHVLGEDVAVSPFFNVTLSDDRVLVQGRGQGHGVGLCQWGARQAALQGRNCVEILAHYFPGSELVTVE